MIIKKRILFVPAVAKSALVTVFTQKKGFTLIEMSIVLVIIGLIIGGILVGRDLIKAAEVNAQIAQITKYSAAVNSFRNKYGGFPGDLQSNLATQFGFAARGTYPGEGDGNGLIEGVLNVGFTSNCGYCTPTGEPVLFWNDLTTAGMMDGNFLSPGGAYSYGDPNPPGISGATLNNWLPPAKMGYGNYIYVWSNGGVNLFGISAVTNLLYAVLTSTPGITVIQAANIDKKIDDGLPQSGNVTAIYVNAGSVIAPTSTTSGGNSTSCYDTVTVAYSVGQNGGNGLNCALSFRFQ